MVLLTRHLDSALIKRVLPEPYHKAHYMQSYQEAIKCTIDWRISSHKKHITFGLVAFDHLSLLSTRNRKLIFQGG